MKYIEVKDCYCCPYHQKGLFGNSEQCARTNHEIKQDMVIAESGFPKSCPLKDVLDKQVKVKKVKKNTVTDEMRDIVLKAYEQYKMFCPSLPVEPVIDDHVVKAVFVGVMRHIQDNEKALKLVNASDFLCGRTGNKWTATFLWIFKGAKKPYPWNIDKILSGNYSKKDKCAFQDKPRVHTAWKK